VVMNE